MYHNSQNYAGTLGSSLNKGVDLCLYNQWSRLLYIFSFQWSTVHHISTIHFEVPFMQLHGVIQNYM